MRVTAPDPPVRGRLVKGAVRGVGARKQLIDAQSEDLILMLKAGSA